MTAIGESIISDKFNEALQHRSPGLVVSATWSKLSFLKISQAAFWEPVDTIEIVACA